MAQVRAAQTKCRKFSYRKSINWLPNISEYTLAHYWMAIWIAIYPPMDWCPCKIVYFTDEDGLWV